MLWSAAVLAGSLELLGFDPRQQIFDGPLPAAVDQGLVKTAFRQFISPLAATEASA